MMRWAACAASLLFDIEQTVAVQYLNEFIEILS